MIATAIAKPLLASDASLPHRDTLLNEDLMGTLLLERVLGLKPASANRCRIQRVKYRFGKSIRVLFDVRFGNETVKVAARTFDAARSSEMQAAKKAKVIGTAKSPCDFFDPELNTAFWVFPNDRKLSNLGVLTDIPNNLARVPARVWKRSRLAAYAPEKCATAQCLDDSGETIAYAKVFAGDEGRRIYDLYKNLNSEEISLPQALAYSEVQRTLLLQAIPGERLADLNSDDSGDVYRKFGVAVASLHRTRPSAELRPFERLSSVELPFAYQTIARAIPKDALQAARILEGLTAFSYQPGPDVCLHGDLHAKNAIWNDGELTLIDLDQVSVGEAAMDIGSFLSGLHYKECTGQLTAKSRLRISKEFCNGYASIRPLPPERGLRRHTAAALFVERALRAVTRYRVEGLENMGRILTAAESILSGGEL